MNITDILGQIGGLQSMATELGISESQGAAGAAALAPAVARSAPAADWHRCSTRIMMAMRSTMCCAWPGN